MSLGKRQYLSWFAVGVLFITSIVLGVALAVHFTSERMVAKLEARLRVPVAIGRVSPGWRAVRLNDIEMGASNEAIHIEVDKLILHAPWWGLLWDGSSALKQVQVKGVRGHADLGHEAAPLLMREFLSRRASAPHQSSEANARRKIPGVEFKDVELSVFDKQGPLVRITQTEGFVGGANTRFSAEQIIVGSEDKERISIEAPALEAVREEGAWRFRRIDVESTDARWRKIANAPEEDVTSVVRRLGMLRRQLSDLRRGPNPFSSTGGDVPASGWAAYLSQDLVANLGKLRITSETLEGRIMEMNADRVSLEAGEKGFHFRGSGRSTDAGAIVWDIRFEREQLLATGDLEFSDLSLSLVAPLFPEIPWHEPGAAFISGSLRLKVQSLSQIHFEGVVDVKGLGLSSLAIAPEPIRNIAFELRGAGYFEPVEHRIVLSTGSLKVGLVNVALTGAAQRTGTQWALTMQVQVPTTACTDLIRAIPRDLMGRYAGFEMGGVWEGALELAIDMNAPDDTRFDATAVDDCRFIRTPPRVREERFRQPFIHSVQEDPEAPIVRMKMGPGSENWVPIAAISPFVIQAVIGHEDRKFLEHGGFAPWAIRDAIKRNLRESRFVLGASTITMQLAKNLFLARDKHLSRKVQEVVLTWWLEKTFSKEEILELYLNVIEYGPELYGIGPASLHYFGRAPADLSPAEAVYFATILPAPKGLYVAYERNKVSLVVLARMRRLIGSLSKRNLIGQSAAQYALSELENFSFRKDLSVPLVERELPPLFDPVPVEGAPPEQAAENKDLPEEEGEPAPDLWEAPPPAP